MKKNKITGWIGTLVLHAVLLLLLSLIAISKPKAQEEGGISVMLGSADVAQGSFEPYTMTEVDVLREPQLPTEVQSSTPIPEPVKEPDMITQDDESTVALPEEKKRENPDVSKTEMTDAEKRAEEERIAAEKKRAEERAAAELASKRIAGAFGKGTELGNKGVDESGKGLQGGPTGNSAEGNPAGAGGYGTFDLNGRSLGTGGLPMPVYNVQDEGRVVVTITVNQAGYVVQTSINKRTNTANAALRKAAEDAARKARFNVVEGVNNQTGTITYYFKLK